MIQYVLDEKIRGIILRNLDRVKWAVDSSNLRSDLRNELFGILELIQDQIEKMDEITDE